MNNIIAYPIGDSLYLNLTNRCTNACTFCVRTTTDGGMGYDLWIDKEPTVEEMVDDIKAKGVEGYKELVLCGYGEPTERYDDMLSVVEQIKEYCPVKVRLNTNGHANLIAGKDVTAKMEGLIDIVSISLNAPDENEYFDVCRPVFGENAFSALIDFAVKCKNLGIDVNFSVVDCIGEKKVAKCKRLAKEVGVPLRVRKMIEDSDAT